MSRPVGPGRATSSGVRHGLGRDSGSVTLEIAILAPAVLLAIFGIVQGALVFHARHVALAAASEGLAAASTLDAPSTAGRAAASDFLTDAGGPGVLTDTSVSVSRTPTLVEVTVSGRAPTLLPGISDWVVSQRASGPVERFTSAELP